jgi:hypothetical protein
MKIRPVGAELCQADGQTDRMTKLIVAFRNFANASKNELSYLTVQVLLKRERTGSPF